MIYVSVGTHREGFDRLVKAVDALAASGKLRGVLAQIGNSGYRPAHIKWFRFAASTEEIEKHFAAANLVITHAGAGAIINAIKEGKPTVVVPRYRKFHEHSDDHQLDICHELERTGRIVAVYDIERLGTAIQQALRLHAITKRKPKAVDIIEEFLWNQLA
ncbi:MAG: beta-1,4-galactosyltransferase [Candidatus Aenigmarchaeota archaeon]|nr:beta-1,4-galactosyltransferase [Candidatus Aenigmarchaeota archaeon]